MTQINPYVGPKPLAKEDPIFGREQELRELRYLLTSERIVLLHSPSGAGKSSLVNARGGLCDQLRTRFDVWLPTRVSKVPDIAVGNRYVWSAAVGFEHELPDDLQRTPELLAATTLKDYVANRPRRPGAPANVLLIFDQFEEILRVDPLKVEEKCGFFSQLGEMLVDPTVWALFVLREDYLAPLDPYVRSVPTHLRQRYRIDLLRRDQAREAVVKLAAQGGHDFAAEAVDHLLTDLAAVNVQNDAGEFVKQTGEFVEPLQMQVVCRNLWNHLPSDAETILPEHVEKFGNVTAALADYYADSVLSIGKGDNGVEWTVRQWVGEKLITPDGIRNQVLRGAKQSEGLENARVQMLVDTHLVRGEKRGGAVWYELAHDRLIDPIRSNNRQWSEACLSAVEKRANLWRSERTDGLLFVDDELKGAKAWAKENRPVVDLQEFLAACEEKEARLQKERRQARRLRWLAFGSTTGGILAALAFAWAWSASNQAQESQKHAEESLKSERTTKDFAANTLNVLKDNVPEEIETLLHDTMKFLNTDKAQDADYFTLQQIRMQIEMGRFFYDAWDRQSSWTYLEEADKKLKSLSIAAKKRSDAARLSAAWQELAGDLNALHPDTQKMGEQFYLSALAKLEQYRKMIGTGEELAVARVHRKLVTLYMDMVKEDETAAATHMAAATTQIDAARSLIDNDTSEEAQSEHAALNDLMAVSAMHSGDLAGALSLLEEAVALDRQVLESAVRDKQPIQRANTALVAHLQHLGDALRQSGSGNPSPYYAEAETHATEVLAAYPNQDETRFMLDLIRHGQSLAYRKGLVPTRPAERIVEKDSTLNRDFEKVFGRFKFGMSTAKVLRLLHGPYKVVPKYLDLPRALEYLTGDVRYFWVAISTSSEFRDFYDLATDCLDDGFDIIVFLFHEDSLIRISYRLHEPPNPGCHERDNLFPDLAKRYQMPLFGTPKKWRLQWDTKQVSIIGSTTPDTLKLDIVGGKARRWAD